MSDLYRLNQPFRIGPDDAVYRQVVRSDDIGPYVVGYRNLVPQPMKWCEAHQL